MNPADKRVHYSTWRRLQKGSRQQQTLLDTENSTKESKGNQIFSPSLLQSEDKNCVFINIIFTAHLVCKYKKGQTLKNIFYCNSFPGCLVIEANTRQPDVPQDGIVFRKLRNFPFCFLRQVLLQFILVKHQLLPWLSYHSHAQLVLQTHD